VISQVHAWADAWRNKDVDAYLGLYADKFIPDGASSKKVWVAQRKQRLSKPGAISLDLDGVKASADGKQAKVTFVQRYSSNGYSDNVSKVLLLQRIDDKWLIVKESVASKLIKIDTADSAVHVQAPKLEASKPKAEEKSAEVKSVEPEAQPEPKPSLFERMLEKIGF